MTINIEKVKERLEKVKTELIELQQTENAQIRDINNQIANHVFLINKSQGKVEELEKTFEEIGMSQSDKDDKLQTYKDIMENAQAEVQTLLQSVDSRRSNATAEAQKLEGKREFLQELLDLSDSDN